MLGKMLNKITSEFKIEIEQSFKDEKRDLTIVDREHRKKEQTDKLGIKNIANKKWYKYHCNKCGYEGWILENSILSGQGCSCCYGRTVVEGINDIPTTAPWMVKYFQGGYEEAKLYTRSSGQKIYPICPDCERIKDTKISINKIYDRQGISCICKDKVSFPNKFMLNMLEQLNIKFISEYSPKWIEPKRYDYYIPLLNIIIEMDGELGHGNKQHSKSKISVKESKAIDDYKDEQAKLHGIEVIRIDCDYKSVEARFNFIKQNILNNKKLNKLFDLSNIKWDKCEEFALSNLIKKVCDIKRNDPNLTTTDISKQINYSQSAVYTWLIQGTKLGWCNYNPKEETSRINSKPIEMFKNGMSIGVFKSSLDIEKQSKILFNIKLTSLYISKVCHNIMKEYNGFVFKYISYEKYVLERDISESKLLTKIN
jgi:hypothetical protein